MSSGTVVAVDVGGTAMKGARVDERGEMAGELVRPTPAGDGPEAVVAAIERLVVDLVFQVGADRGAARPRAVAVVVPGIVDADAGVAVFAGNLGWRDVPLRERLAAATGLTTVVDHDVRTAGLAERTVGALRGEPDHVLVVLGTGIAAAVATGEAAVRGALGLSGELGHVPVWPDGEPCPCGQRGCLERYASAAAIARHHAAGGGEAGLGAREIVARLGVDPAADRAWAQATEALGIALTTCTMLLDPGLIVLAGGLSQAGAALLDPVRAQLAARVAWREPPPVALSPLGARAGLRGAAILAWRAVGHSG